MYRILIIIAVLLLLLIGGGAIILALVDVPAPVKAIEKVIPDARFPR
jgi:hypothetical protein